MRVVIASSGLGHVARGIEAWADDLATALAARNEVLLCKAGTAIDHSASRVVLARESPATSKLLRFLPRSLSWRVGLGSGYEIEQTSFAINLVRLLRRNGSISFTSRIRKSR